jgi:hypothetical protein
MKTEEEITERLEIHNQRLTLYHNRYMDENSKTFKNKELIKFLLEQKMEEQAAIVHLSWVLI